MMLQAKLGVTSPWFEKMQKQGILNSPMELQVSYTTAGNFATIIGASSKLDLFLKNIKSQLLEVPVTEESFVFQKRKHWHRLLENLMILVQLLLKKQNMDLKMIVLIQHLKQFNL